MESVLIDEGQYRCGAMQCRGACQSAEARTAEHDPR
jgi:hypothetical protein